MAIDEKQYGMLLKAIVGVIMLCHGLTLAFPLVNLEFAFVSAAEYFSSGNRQLLDIFFEYQANTLGVSFVSHVLHKLIPILPIDAVPRLGSVLGIPILAYALFVAGGRLGLDRADRLFVITLVLVNPIVWVYSQRGTADFLPVAVAMLGLALLIEARSMRGYIVSGLVIGFGIFLKYHAVVVLMAACMYLVLRDRKLFPARIVLQNGLLVVVTASAIPVLYLIAVKYNYGFWVTPPTYQEIFQFDIRGAYSNFVIYATYMTLLLLPLSVMHAARVWSAGSAAARWGYVVILVIFVSGGVLVGNVGEEMNFGPLDRFIHPSMLPLGSGLGAACLVISLLGLAVGQGRSERRNLLIASALATFIFLFILSLTRPSQRYLLLVLPLMYLAMLTGVKEFLPRYLKYLIVVGCLGLSFFATAYQFVVGSAAWAMASEIDKAGVLAETEPGAIESHVGHLFFPNDQRNDRFTVIQGRDTDAVFTVERSLAGFVSRSYSLVERQP